MVQNINQKQKFISTFLATILIIRFIIFQIPRTSTIYTDKFHHFYVGIAFLIIYFLIRHRKYSEYFLAFILGLIADQISQAPFYLADLFGFSLAPLSFWHYWSAYSVISTTVIVIISIILINKYTL